MSNLFHMIMEADGDLVEPFNAGSAAETVESEAGTQDNPQPEDAPPPSGGGEDNGLVQPFDDTATDDGEYMDDQQNNQDDQHEDQSLSKKANSVLNQSLYQKLVNRNQEIEDTLTNLQTITPVLPYDIIQSNDVSINRLKAALTKGQTYALEKFIDSGYGENCLFYQKLDALYVLLLNEINRNLKKVKL